MLYVLLYKEAGAPRCACAAIKCIHAELIDRRETSVHIVVNLGYWSGRQHGGNGGAPLLLHLVGNKANVCNCNIDRL